MSTQFTVDDSSSFQCFCGSKICCCQFLPLPLRLRNTSFHIIQQIKKQQQKEMIKTLYERETMERRKNRKSIFGKKGLMDIHGGGGSGKKEGSEDRMIGSHGLLPMFETKQTLRRGEWKEGREVNRIFTNNKRNTDMNMDNNTTILFNPYEFDRYQSSMELESHVNNQINNHLPRELKYLNESKEVLEEFLESTLFKNINQIEIIVRQRRQQPERDLNINSVLSDPFPQLQPSSYFQTFLSPLPQILHHFHSLTSSSLSINNPLTPLPSLQSQKLHLYSCLHHANSLCDKFLIAIQQIQKHFQSKQNLLNNFSMDNFLSGEWLPNWQRLKILLPSYPFMPESRRVEKYQQIIQYEIQPLLEKIKQSLETTYFIPELYIITRTYLVQTLQKFKLICQNLYYLVRESRVNGDYEIAYRYYKEDIVKMIEGGELKQRQKVKEMVRERELYVVKLKYLREIHDRIWMGEVGEKVIWKVVKDVERLKREGYKRR